MPRTPFHTPDSVSAMRPIRFRLLLPALLANGGSAGQVTVVSYGEERPTCTESADGCWSQNRRVEIIYTAK